MEHSIQQESDNGKYRYFIMKTKFTKSLIPGHWTMVGEIDSKYISELVSLLRNEESLESELDEDLHIKLEIEDEVETDSCVRYDDGLGVLEAFGKSGPDIETTTAAVEPSADTRTTPDASVGEVLEVVHTIYPSSSPLPGSKRSYPVPSTRGQIIAKRPSVSVDEHVAVESIDEISTIPVVAATVEDFDAREDSVLDETSSEVVPWAAGEVAEGAPVLTVKSTTSISSICGPLFADQKKVDQHRGEQRHGITSRQNVPCSSCDERFYSNFDLTNHIQRAHSKCKDLVCTSCGKEFPTKSYLKYHIRAVHSDMTNNWACDICSLKLKTKAVLKVHRRIHFEDKQYLCVTCGAAFRARDKLRRHEMLHSGERPLMCDECGKGFTCTSQLRRHKTNVHVRTDQTFSCPCGEGFSTLLALNRHRRLEHGVGAKVCETCGKSIAGGPQSLERHMRTHTGEKPFICDRCGKAFIREALLRSHERIHTGEKPYSCDICHKKFIDRYCLTRHKLVHSDEKRYECSNCHKTFKRSNSLNNHRKRRCIFSHVDSR